MTPKEIHAACKALATEIGSSARVGVMVDEGVQSKAKCIVGFCRPVGFGANAPSIVVYADDWQDAFDEMRERWAEMREHTEAGTIKRMALAIIRLTAEQGECTDAALRAELSPGDVDRFGERAVTLADEMASNGPFSIVRTVGANAA